MIKISELINSSWPRELKKYEIKSMSLLEKFKTSIAANTHNIIEYYSKNNNRKWSFRPKLKDLKELKAFFESFEFSLYKRRVPLVASTDLFESADQMDNFSSLLKYSFARGEGLEDHDLLIYVTYKSNVHFVIPVKKNKITTTFGYFEALFRNENVWRELKINVCSDSQICKIDVPGVHPKYVAKTIFETYHHGCAKSDGVEESISVNKTTSFLQPNENAKIKTDRESKIKINMNGSNLMTIVRIDESMKPDCQKYIQAVLDSFDEFMKNITVVGVEDYYKNSGIQNMIELMRTIDLTELAL